MRHFGPLFCLVCLLLCGARWGQAKNGAARRDIALGDHARENGELREALRFYLRAQQEDPESVVAVQRALPLWMKFGEYETARRALERVTLRCNRCSFAWYALGGLYRKEARYSLAIHAYQAYLQRVPDDPDAFFGLGMALVANEDPSAARVLQRYLRLENRPQRSEYREHALAALQRLGGETTVPVENSGKADGESEKTCSSSSSRAQYLRELRQGRSGFEPPNDLPRTTQLELMAQVAGERKQVVASALFRFWKRLSSLTAPEPVGCPQRP